MYSSLWLSSIPLYICGYFIHSSEDAHLRCFYILAIVDSATVNSGLLFWFPRGICQVVGLLDHMIAFTPGIWRNLHTLFHSGCIKLHSHQQCKMQNKHSFKDTDELARSKVKMRSEVVSGLCGFSSLGGTACLCIYEASFNHCVEGTQDWTYVKHEGFNEILSNSQPY